VTTAGSHPKVTKQSATRQQVLDLIGRLGIGTAIPSERQLSADLGVSRLTVRAALDDLKYQLSSCHLPKEQNVASTQESKCPSKPSLAHGHLRKLG